MSNSDYISRADARRAILKVAPQLAYLIDDIPTADVVISGNCVDCGRGSRSRKDHSSECPIEEHYALPRDGYCHLYEKKDNLK